MKLNFQHSVSPSKERPLMKFSTFGLSVGGYPLMPEAITTGYGIEASTVFFRNILNASYVFADEFIENSRIYSKL